MNIAELLNEEKTQILGVEGMSDAQLHAIRTEARKHDTPEAWAVRFYLIKEMLLRTGITNE